MPRSSSPGWELSEGRLEAKASCGPSQAQGRKWESERLPGPQGTSLSPKRPHYFVTSLLPAATFLDEGDCLRNTLECETH